MLTWVPGDGEEEVVGAGQSRMGSCLIIPKEARGGGMGGGIIMPAAGSLGAPTCSPRGGLKEQEVKVFLHREEAELAGGGAVEREEAGLGGGGI